MRYFHNLQNDEQEQILDYKLMVYFCSGTDSEKLEWFRTINIAGEELSDQELRNAVYSGSWVTEAKKYFSKNGCVAYNIASQYMSGTVNRQDYLATAINWIAKRDRITIEIYMAMHQNDLNANELWLYFKSVIDWVGVVFPKYRKEMKGTEWGILFNEFKDDKSLDPKTLEAEISKLMQDEDVTSKKGIYEYLLTGKEKYLNIRAFTDNQKREAFERQKGVCLVCQKNKSEKINYEISEMEADHITPWHEGGKTDAKNCQMLCKLHNRMKSGT
jgi:hypothetical protein